MKLPEDRLTKMVSGSCKCSEGSCYNQFSFKEVKSFLDTFQARSKTEQDTILFMAWTDGAGGTRRTTQRREFYFLGKYMKRICFEGLLGIGSHRVDKIGFADLRYGKRAFKPSPLTASIDAFCLILYNSLAEPLPTQCLDLILLFLQHVVYEFRLNLYFQRMLFCLRSGWFG